MKIAILGLPRSCSTYVTQTLRKIYNFPSNADLGEFPMHNDPFQDRKIKNYTDYIVKIMVNRTSTDSEYSRYFELDWNQFDLVVVTTRQSYADSCCSLYSGLQNNLQLQKLPGEEFYNPVSFVVPIEFVNYFAEHIKTFNKLQSNINRSYHTISYEDCQDYDKFKSIISGITKKPFPEDYKTGSLPTNFNYQELCANYKEVKEILGS